MLTTRRGFMRWVSGGAAWLAAGRGAATVERPAHEDLALALDIHRATRNTRLGALGRRLRAGSAAQRPWKPYPKLPRGPLAKPSWDAGRPLMAVVGEYAPAPLSGGALSQGELSRLLFLANGITGRVRGIALRAAPSAGALYAGEVYVVAERVEGLAPGVYYYSVVGHRLVRLREGSALEEVAASLERPAEAEGAAAAVLLSNVFERYRVRYANRGYRYALIDSGHIGANLRLAAAELGVSDRAPLRWEDDRLNALLEVDGREEAVCALHLVGRAGQASSSEAKAAPHAKLVERGLGQGAGEDAGASPESYHEATKLVRASLETDAAGGGRRADAPDADGEAPDNAAKRARKDPDTPVHEAIRVRRSTRAFQPAAMARDDLLSVLDAAQGNPSLAFCPGLDLYAVVHRVDGLAPGLYRFDPAAGRLEPRREAALADALVDAALGQPKTAEGAAALIGVAHLAEAVGAAGARAYRHLLLEAGATAQRVYLAAEAGGHTARNLAAYYDDDLNELLGLDGEREAAVHLTAVGRGD